MILKSLYENIVIKISTMNNHENFNVENFLICTLSDGPKGVSFSHDFEITKFMGLKRKNHESLRCHRQKNKIGTNYA